MTENDELLRFFKALADANRLKIVGLLARQAYTVEQLAAILGLGASTVSHHLSKLSEAGLVSASAQSYYNFYRLENEALEDMARRLLMPETLPAVATDVDVNAFERGYDQKVIHDYVQADGRLKTIPSQRKKLLVILDYLANDFAMGKTYNEKEVNEILARRHEDTASLRRELIGAGLMGRESDGRSYWRKDKEKQA